MQGWPEFRDGLALLRGLVERHWETVHPQLDPDDDLDPTVRVNTLAALADQDATLRTLRRAPLVRSRVVGAFGLRQIELARGDIAPIGDEAVPELSAIEGAFAEVDLEALSAITGAVKGALEDAAGIENAVSDHVGAGMGVQLGPLLAELKRADKFLSEQLAKRRVGAGGVGEGDEGAGGSAAASGDGVPARLSGEIRNREDVARALDKLCEYYEKYEPSSPVPLLLMRAKRLATKSFIEIMRDLTPNGLDQALSIGGIVEEG